MSLPTTTPRKTRPRPLYGEAEFEVEVDDMLEHIGGLDDQHIREAITTLQGCLEEDDVPTTADSSARDIAGWPSLERDRFLADLKREVLMVGGTWP